MKHVVSRRSMLAGIGYAAACGSVASQVLSAAQAAEAAAPAAAAAQETVLSMIFLASVKSRFDAKKYTAKHLPLLKKSYGESVSRIELRTGVGSARGIPSDVLATTTIYIVDLPGFIQKMSASAPQINADLADASSGQVVAQADRVLLASGESRADISLNTQVFSTYYRDKPEGTFDFAYYTDTYLPKLRSLYGEAAVRRIEINKGMVQGGQKPPMVASSHLFVREHDAFETAERLALAELTRLDPKYTNITPLWADLRVTAFV